MGDDVRHWRNDIQHNDTQHNNKNVALSIEAHAE